MPPSCLNVARDPGTSARRRAATGRSAGARRDQRELVAARQRFDARLLAPRGAAIGHRRLIHQLDGQPAGGVAAGLARAVALQARLRRPCSSPCRASRRRSAACRPRRRRSSTFEPSLPARSARRRGARPAAPCGSGPRRTGDACIERSRTSRQDSPSLSSAGTPMISAVATSTPAARCRRRSRPAWTRGRRRPAPRRRPPGRRRRWPASPASPR